MGGLFGILQVVSFSFSAPSFLFGLSVSLMPISQGAHALLSPVLSALTLNIFLYWNSRASVEVAETPTQRGRSQLRVLRGHIKANFSNFLP